MAALSAATVGMGLLTLSVVPASAATSDVTIPIPQTQEPPYLVAASGASAIVERPGSATDASTYLATTDNGGSWKPADIPGLEDSYARFVGGGHVYFEPYSDDGENYIVNRYDFATNSTSKVSDVSSEFTDLSPTMGLTLLVSDADGTVDGLVATEIATGTETALPYKKRPHSAETEIGGHLSTGSRALVSTINRSSSGAAGTGYLDLLPLDGEKGLSATVSGLTGASLRGDQVVYLTTSKTSAGICFRSASAWTKPSCKTLKKGNYIKATANLSLGVDWAAAKLERVPFAYEGFSVDGVSAPAAPMQVKAPTGATLEDFTGAGDSDRPFAYLVTSTGGSVATYQSSGALVNFADYTVGEGSLDALQVTPAGVVAADNAPASDLPGYRVWSRSISGGAAGSQTPFPTRASSGGVSASDARTIIRNVDGVHLFDRGGFVRDLPTTSNVQDLSGAYYLADTSRDPEMRRVDGTRMQKAVSAIFGSKALRGLSRNRYQVVDVTGAAKTVAGVLPTRATYGLDEPQLWGDFVMVAAANDVDDTITVVFNYRDPSQVYAIDGYPRVLGDGFAIVKGQDGLALWKFLKGTSELVVPSEDYTDAFASDRSHALAYVGDGEIVVRQFDGVGSTQPLVLGLSAPTRLNNKPMAASWKPQIDATKALGPGTLIVKDSAGVIVRSKAVNATADGSIRDLSWNGRADDDVTPVPPGTYTWELSMMSADGTGNLALNTDRDKLDSGLITGTIKVTSSFLGTVSGPAPKISDMTPVVDQPLTAKPGTWKPAGTTWTYQWLRGGLPIPGATASKYTVAASDLGTKLKVRVTATADGWKPVTKSSGTTAKVARALLSPAPLPTIDKPAPIIGDTVTATAGTWGPDPVALSHQWYRVLGGKRTAIADATQATYLVDSADAGFQLQVSVTGTKDGYSTKTVTSLLTAAVAAG